MMLFEPAIFIVGGATVALALLDKTFSSYGFHGMGITLRILIPLAGLIASIYFIETNPLLEWLK